MTEELILSKNTGKTHLPDACSKTSVHSELGYIEPRSGWSKAKSMALSL